MHLIKPQWLTHPGKRTLAHHALQAILCSHEYQLTLHLLGELKDFEVYSCHVSPDGSRLVTAAGGTFTTPAEHPAQCAAPKHDTN
jgi:protein HIRA/HIR1